MRLPLPLKILNVVLFLLFALFSWVQYNDIDPEVYDRPSSIDAATWLLFYALVSALFLITVFKAPPRWILALAILACLVELGRTAPGIWENFFGEQPFTLTQQSMSAEDPRVELSREFFGALITLGAVVLLWWERARYHIGPTAKDGQAA